MSSLTVQQAFDALEKRSSDLSTANQTLAGLLTELEKEVRSDVPSEHDEKKFKHMVLHTDAVQEDDSGEPS